jgi:hypothetical protein
LFDSQEFVVVDDGITIYNNPVFQVFLMATVAPYWVEWLAGEDKPLAVSIGTGTSPQANTDLEPGEMICSTMRPPFPLP